jgi:hypothetical protein
VIERLGRRWGMDLLMSVVSVQMLGVRRVESGGGLFWTPL